MPLEWKRPKRTEDELSIQKLIQILRDEYKLGENSNNKEPSIIIEELKKNGPLHIYVVWSKWVAYSHRERSEIIMEAFEGIEDFQEDIHRVTIAMGSTPEEWERSKPIDD